jgi:hypothetical protein
MVTVLQGLAALILQARIEGGQMVRVGFSGNRSVAIVTLSRKQTRLRGMHAVAAVSSTGDIVGRVLRANGTGVCDFGGAYDFDTACVTVAGCGLSGTACS